MAVRKILLLNGPNLDMLGMREPEVYGRKTIAELERQVVNYAREHDIQVTCSQSNSESRLIESIHSAAKLYDGVVYNPGAHTHYSYALRDAIGSIDTPVVEVHISDIDEREPFRRISVIAPACVAQVKGLGFDSYCRAIDILLEHDGLGRLGEGFDRGRDASEHILIADPAPDPVATEEPETPSAGEAEELDVAEKAGAMAAPIAQPESNEKPEEASMIEKSKVSEAMEAVEESEQPDAAKPTEASETSAESKPASACVDLGAMARERQALVQHVRSRMGLDALMVRDTANICWITAFDGVFDEERAHALLVADGQMVLHTDSRYSNALRTAAARVSSNVEISDERASHVGFAKGQLAHDGRPFEGKLGIEDSITYAEFAQMSKVFGPASLAATSNVVLGLRSVKNEVELARLRAAQAITDAAFSHIVDFIRPGMTEREVQLELDYRMLRGGADGLSFSSIVATGPNGADPHAVPGDTVLEAGQCVVMDFGARVNGYCSDMTRVVFLGQPDDEKARAWETLRRANEAVQAMLRPGVTGKQAHETAERILAEGGFAGKMGHGLGHGVGIEIHELPVLSPRNENPLVEGNVVTVEPGIYLPGKFGMRLEDCGVVTAAGYSAFSTVSHEMVVI